MIRVTVIMAAYNAAKYIDVQIQSILAQSNVDVYLRVRDDGSTDNTVDILSRYESELDNFRSISGNNLGPKDCFIETLRFGLETDSEYFAFSDADDYWFPSKLFDSVEELRRLPKSVPTAVCRAWTVSDENLNPIRTISTPEITRCFKNALVECHAGGHTMVFNRAAAIAIASSDASQAVMHDSWAYLIISALGHVSYIAQPASFYRQHGGNFDGAPQNKPIFEKIRDLRNRLKSVISYQRQAGSFIAQWGHKLSAEQLADAIRFTRAGHNFAATLNFAIRGPRYHNWLSNIIAWSALFILSKERHQ